MILIAHRGLVNGPNKKIENNPNTIKQALNEGFDVEIDLRFNDAKLYLGHDKPKYETTLDFITMPGLWIHCKTIETLLFCIKHISHTNFFFHEEDPCTLTSKGWIWTHPNTPILTEKTIAVVPERTKNIEEMRKLICGGICSDYVSKLR